MRKYKREITDPAEVVAVLKAATVMRLAMSVEDQPYVVPVNFGFEPGRLYFHCAVEGRKLDMIRANPRVAFEVETDVEVALQPAACGCTTYFRSVIGFGTARVVTDEAEKRHGLDVLMAHHGAPPGNYDPKVLALTCVVALEIESMTGKRKVRDPTPARMMDQI